MSGGHFDYKQHQLNYIADEIEEVLDCINGKHHDDCYTTDYESGKRQLSCYKSDYKDHPNFVKELKLVRKELRELAIRVGRIDWVISGDDSVECWRERLPEDVAEFRENDSKSEYSEGLYV
jgi:hypothetical protein